jgi:L-lactate dehydrogenase complex protein LldG
VIRGKIGVAENGAIWVDEETMGVRALPYITERLMLVVKASDLVWNMHQAYQKLGGDIPGFGAFIAGPSKTADIEQALVIGAHGPKGLQVVVVRSDI